MVRPTDQESPTIEKIVITDLKRWRHAEPWVGHLGKHQVVGHRVEGVEENWQELFFGLCRKDQGR